MSETAKESPITFVAKMLKQLGDEESIEVDIEPKWGYVGRITRVDGKYSYFRGTNFDLNGLGSMEIARDKGYASHYLEKSGYNIIPTGTFFSPRFAQHLKSADDPNAAYEYACKIGFPVIVKPNSLTQGQGVCVANNKQTFQRAVNRVSKMDRVYLVQPLMSGHDYRVVVLDDDVISGYERLALSVTGDGTSTITELLQKKQIEFKKTGRDTVIKQADFRIDDKLKRQNLTRASILESAQKVDLLDNRNLSTGGDSLDVTGKIDPSYMDLCRKITRDMGLRYCGVDLMVQGDITKPLSPENNYAVIEVNAAPGIDNYAKSGKEQQLIVAEMYRRILRVLAGLQ